MNKNSLNKMQMLLPSSLLSIGSLLLVVSIGAGCTNQPAKRSAVDARRLCNPANPYSTCLSTEPAASNSVAAPVLPAPRANNPPRETPDVPVPVVGPDAVPGAGPDAVPVAGPAAPSPAADPDAARAEALKEVSKSVGDLGKAIVDNINKGSGGSGSGNGAGGGSGGAGEKTTSGGYLVTFSKDSFVGVAEGSVVKNCFIPTGTVVEVKSAPAKVKNFVSLGVNQLLAIGVVSIAPEAAVNGCSLVGKDFVYLGSHAAFQPKP